MQNEVIIIGCNGYVLAINSAMGTENWRVKLRAGILGGSRGSDVSVLVDGDKVFAGCWGRIYALRISDGSILWENELNGVGFNEVALAMPGVNTQFITRVEHHGS
jgi:outer membrane protein assembly factor BamB